MSTQHQSWLPVPPYPVFILLTVTKAIYLFHLERTLCSGHFSLECSVAFLPPAPSWVVCLTWPFHWVMFVMCPHAGTGGPLCGSLDLQFPGGSAPECPSGPLKGHLTCNNECLGDLSARAVAAPCVPPDSHLSLGLIHFCTWFYFFSLLWGFLVWVWFRFRFPT